MRENDKKKKLNKQIVEALCNNYALRKKVEYLPKNVIKTTFFLWTSFQYNIILCCYKTNFRLSEYKYGIVFVFYGDQTFSAPLPTLVQLC